jgi:transcriptional regulator with PAS, ATPase and Fis domain
VNGDEISVTIPLGEGGTGHGKTTALLLIVGSAHEAGGTQTPRIVRLPECLEIGRGRPPTDPGDGAQRLELRDKLLSRVHLRIHRTPAGYEVEDAGSLNGTFVGGRRIDDRTRLGDGSLVVFGGHAAVFRRASPEALAAMEEELTAPFGPVPTVSPELATTAWRLRRLARSGSDILLTGETGSGKEVFARAVHRAAGRAGRFVAINCAAIPAELAESELFGYTRGAHSTAREAKLGLIQSAQGGTLFLDEIGDMSPPLQAKLLRFLQDHEVAPLGATTTTRVDVQVIAATNNSAMLGAGGDLRTDLVARFGAQANCIPPLRDRPEDLGALLHHFLAPAGVQEIEPGAFHALCLYGWPRNVRELEKVIAEVIAVGEGGQTLTVAQLPGAITSPMARGRTADTGGAPRRASPSRAELVALLRQHHGNVSHVARTLDRQWAVVWRWLVKHQIDPAEYRK